ncbi:MAG: hypothetical protein JWN48_4969 [Myxococcaceae bacterium]|nr:hypothetical protein [Myxococcaceae bacterium]
MSQAPQKASAVKLGHKATAGELARASLRSAIAQMRRNTRGAQKDRDPDFTHQLRVGARRARVVLRLFRRPIGKARARVIEHDLRWIFRLLGELRDRDLLLHEVVDPLSTDEVMPSLELLAGELGRERKLAARSVKRALRSKRYARLLLSLRALQHEVASLDGQDKAARKWAKKRLDERLHAVLSQRDAALGPDELARHQLRKELKKLRYAAELVRSLWSKKKVKHFLAQMEALQDTLGALNDVATGRRLLPIAAARARGDTAEAVELCERALLEKLSAQAPSLEPAFREFESSAPFWHG